MPVRRLTWCPSGTARAPRAPIGAGEWSRPTYQIRDEIARTITASSRGARHYARPRGRVHPRWRDPGTPSLITEAGGGPLRDPCAAAPRHGVHQGVDTSSASASRAPLLPRLLAKPLPAISTSRACARSSRRHARARGRHRGRRGLGLDVLVCDEGRCVLGRLSLSQVLRSGRTASRSHPRSARGDVVGTDPAAAEDDRSVRPRLRCDRARVRCAAVRPTTTRRSSYAPCRAATAAARRSPRRPADRGLRPRGVAPREAARRAPALRRDVLAQLDAVINRLWTAIARCACSSSTNDTARRAGCGAYVAAPTPRHRSRSRAGHRRGAQAQPDHPDLVLIDATLRGVMNALELWHVRTRVAGRRPQRARRYRRGAAARPRPVRHRARAFIADDSQLAGAILDRVRLLATAAPRRRGKPSTISG